MSSVYCIRDHLTGASFTKTIASFVSCLGKLRAPRGALDDLVDVETRPSHARVTAPGRLSHTTGNEPDFAVDETASIGGCSDGDQWIVLVPVDRHGPSHDRSKSFQANAHCRPRVGHEGSAEPRPITAKRLPASRTVGHFVEPSSCSRDACCRIAALSTRKPREPNPSCDGRRGVLGHL